MSGAADFIMEHSAGGLLSWQHQLEASERFGLSLAEVEGVILDKGLLPGRYQRNRQTISQADQRELFRSRVTVIGCGGLGCYVVEELARLGVGQIMVVDPDTFEEHNLNRQLYSTPEKLGEVKVLAALQRVAEVNPAVTVIPYQKAFSAENGKELLAGSRVAVDALDNIGVRMELAEICNMMGLPLVHGAIAGWFGHVTTLFPGDDTLQNIYGPEKASKGVEASLGNPSFTPALVAALEVAEVCKLLLGQGKTLKNRTLMIDLLNMEFQDLEL